MSAGIAGKPHAHPSAEFDAPAWDLERLRAHMADMHDLTLAVADLLVLSAIHAAEHPEDAGIARETAQ